MKWSETSIQNQFLTTKNPEEQKTPRFNFKSHGVNSIWKKVHNSVPAYQQVSLNNSLPPLSACHLPSTFPQLKPFLLDSYYVGMACFLKLSHLIAPSLLMRLQFFAPSGCHVLCTNNEKTSNSLILGRHTTFPCQIIIPDYCNSRLQLRLFGSRNLDNKP